jgi:rubrerythrin
MAVDRTALDQALTRELAEVVAPDRPLRFRLGDAFLPEGTAPPPGSRLRCCTCGFGTAAAQVPEPCPLCGSRAWELLPALSLALRPTR